MIATRILESSSIAMHVSTEVNYTEIGRQVGNYAVFTQIRLEYDSMNLIFWCKASLDVQE